VGYIARLCGGTSLRGSDYQKRRRVDENNFRGGKREGSERKREYSKSSIAFGRTNKKQDGVVLGEKDSETSPKNPRSHYAVNV